MDLPGSFAARILPPKKREGGKEGGRTYLDGLGEGSIEEGDAVGQVLVHVDVLGEQVTHTWR